MAEPDPSTPLYRHAAPHRELLRRYRAHGSREFYLSLFPALAFFMASLVVNAAAISFSTERASNPVTDLILSNTPVFDVDMLFVYGTVFGAAVSIFLCLAHPKRIPFALYTVALFFFIRAGFVSLTHIAPFSPHTASDFTSPLVNRMFFGADRFFSGHAGLPFLGALVFWHDKIVRAFFIALSVFFSIIVLMGHLHYSIDVASAYFITYSIYHIALWLFPKERAMLVADELSAR